jgi:DNA-binding PadR family transcriptional regulator
MQHGLTELEGAVLSEIHHRGALTAFKVRKAFQDSPSIEWSGSSGAVYPAIRRMTDNGLIQEMRMAQARKVNHLSLTQAGIDSLTQWIVAPGRAVNVGLDPFRLRAGLWPHLSPEVRKAGLQRVKGEIEAEIVHLRAYLETLDLVERRRVELSIILQETRLQWLTLHWFDELGSDGRG